MRRCFTSDYLRSLSLVRLTAVDPRRGDHALFYSGPKGRLDPYEPLQGRRYHSIVALRAIRRV